MAEQKFKKEVISNGYGEPDNKNDFVAESELTVTITLAEYRELVTAKATMDRRIKEADDKRIEQYSKCNAFEKENSELKKELYDLQKQLNETKDKTEGEENDTV